jgi:hypothetical protein
MSIKSIISAGTVLLLLGAVPSAYGQRDPQGDKGQGQPHGQQAAPKQPQAKPTARPAPATPTARPAPATQRTSPARPTARPAPTAQRTQPAYGGAYHGGVKPAATPTHGGVHPSGVPQQQSQVRNGYRVPDDRFGLYFGSGHFFEIGNLPLLFVGGYPRFQYDGYWVTFMDPWPENWPPLWYEADNVYIDWGGDGYYLYDTNYPGIGIAVTISF